MGRCSTCVYRFDCHGPCCGYEPDEEERAQRDEYYEQIGDIERDESE